MISTGQTEELVEALLTEYNLTLPRLTPDFLSDSQTAGGQSEVLLNLQPHVLPPGITADRNHFLGGIAGCEGDCLPAVSRLDERACRYKRVTINLISNQLFFFFLLFISRSEQSHFMDLITCTTCQS